jgi:predicted ATPase/DNA-binding XRE family transcriptional regulator
MGVPESFGKLLQIRRKSLDMTQKELAQRTSCSVSAIRKLEAETRRPSREIAELLAESLDIPKQERQVFIQLARGIGHNREDLLVTFNKSTIKEYRRHGRIANLPVPATPLIGRSHELAEISHLLQDPNCRLISLIGRGGVGKTRLAIAAALINQKSFEDGVYFVSLMPVKSTDLLITTIAEVLGFEFYGQEDPQKELRNFLSDKNFLLVLDNFERLIPAADLISGFLIHAPLIKIMITSNERLNIQGEWVSEIDGLTVPPTGNFEDLKDYSSVNLFVQSAARARPGFSLKPEDHQAIARICQLLEGLPLGIELAASWVRLLTCQEIAREIEHDLDFVTTSARDLPARHRSLRAVFDHSWGMLTTEERNTLARMSVFRGAFKREASEQVAGASLSILLALIDKSIFCRAGDNRFEIHNLIQQYAHDHLQNDEDENYRIHNLHCLYYSNWLNNLENKIKGPEQSSILAELRAEIDNIRLAWDWAVTHHHISEIRKAVRCLSWYYELMGWFVEGEIVFRNAANILEDYRSTFEITRTDLDGSSLEFEIALGQVITFWGFFLLRSGRQDEARVTINKAIELLRRTEDKRALADALTALSLIIIRMGEDEVRQQRLLL